MAIPGLNQWHLAGALLNLPNNMMERVSSIALKVSLAAAAAQLGLWLAKMGISQVCPERERCQLADIDHDTFKEAFRVCNKEWPQKALVDPANLPFGWEVDPSKREIALVDPTHPPLDWKNGTYDECIYTNLGCPPIIPEPKLCESIRSGVDYVEGIVSTISEKAKTVSSNLFFLRPVVNGLIWGINRIARRV